MHLLWAAASIFINIITRVQKTLTCCSEKTIRGHILINSHLSASSLSNAKSTRGNNPLMHAAHRQRARSKNNMRNPRGICWRMGPRHTCKYITFKRQKNTKEPGRRGAGDAATHRDHALEGDAYFVSLFSAAIHLWSQRAQKKTRPVKWSLGAEWYRESGEQIRGADLTMIWFGLLLRGSAAVVDETH